MQVVPKPVRSVAIYSSSAPREKVRSHDELEKQTGSGRVNRPGNDAAYVRPALGRRHARFRRFAFREIEIALRHKPSTFPDCSAQSARILSARFCILTAVPWRRILSASRLRLPRTTPQGLASSTCVERMLRHETRSDITHCKPHFNFHAAAENDPQAKVALRSGTSDHTRGRSSPISARAKVHCALFV